MPDAGVAVRVLQRSRRHPAASVAAERHVDRPDVVRVDLDGGDEPVGQALRRRDVPAVPGHLRGRQRAADKQRALKKRRITVRDLTDSRDRWKAIARRRSQESAALRRQLDQAREEHPAQGS